MVLPGIGSSFFCVSSNFIVLIAMGMTIPTTAIERLSTVRRLVRKVSETEDTGAKTRAAELIEKYAPRTGLTLLSVEEHRGMLAGAEFEDVAVMEEAGRGWICCVGRKPNTG